MSCVACAIVVAAATHASAIAIGVLASCSNMFSVGASDSCHCCCAIPSFARKSTCTCWLKFTFKCQASMLGSISGRLFQTKLRHDMHVLCVWLAVLLHDMLFSDA